MLTAVHHVDAGVEQLEHIFVALAVLAAGHVGVGQFVDDDSVRMTGEDRVDVHLFEINAAVGNDALGNDFEVADLRRRFPCGRAFQQGR